MQTIAQAQPRYPKGQAHHMAKLSFEQVQSMRLKREAGYSYGRLALIFGCSAYTVRDIVTNRTRREA